jgi:hypothetical protein
LLVALFLRELSSQSCYLSLPELFYSEKVGCHVELKIWVRIRSTAQPDGALPESDGQAGKLARAALG